MLEGRNHAILTAHAKPLIFPFLLASICHINAAGHDVTSPASWYVLMRITCIFCHICLRSTYYRATFSCRDGEEEALTAEERFKRAREAMRVRDATDRAAQKAARRSKKLDRKERLRAQAAGEADDDAGVQLGATSLGASMSEGETTRSFIRS